MSKKAYKINIQVTFGSKFQQEVFEGYMEKVAYGMANELRDFNFRHVRNNVALQFRHFDHVQDETDPIGHYKELPPITTL